MSLLLPTITHVREYTSNARRQGLRIGCVPTMGALHAGHGSLVDRAREESDVVVLTIFVNPIQFDRKDDYERYAKNLEFDMLFCESHGVDAVFAPSVEEMYPEPVTTFVDSPEVARHLCGATRPGHFRGVATVVTKLFHIVQPDAAYFGEKDAQQLAVIRKMVSDLNFPVRIVSVTTVREADGLALSSRNERLTAEERRKAPLIYRALQGGVQMMAGGERQASAVKAAVVALLESEPAFRVDYVDIVDDVRMQPLDTIAGDVRLAAAVWVGSTRLIDNVLFSPLKNSDESARRLSSGIEA